MLSKKRDPFVNTIRKPEETIGVSAEKEPPRGPTLYLSDVDLPLTDKDINETLIGEIRLIPRRISKSSEGKVTKTSFDLEITGIRIK